MKTQVKLLTCLTIFGCLSLGQSQAHAQAAVGGMCPYVFMTEGQSLFAPALMQRFDEKKQRLVTDKNSVSSSKFALDTGKLRRAVEGSTLPMGLRPYKGELTEILALVQKRIVIPTKDGFKVRLELIYGEKQSPLVVEYQTRNLNSLEVQYPVIIEAREKNGNVIYAPSTKILYGKKLQFRLAFSNIRDNKVLQRVFNKDTSADSIKFEIDSENISDLKVGDNYQIKIKGDDWFSFDAKVIKKTLHDIKDVAFNLKQEVRLLLELEKGHELEIRYGLKYATDKAARKIRIIYTHEKGQDIYLPKEAVINEHRDAIAVIQNPVQIKNAPETSLKEKQVEKVEEKIEIKTEERAEIKVEEKTEAKEEAKEVITENEQKARDLRSDELIAKILKELGHLDPQQVQFEVHSKVVKDQSGARQVVKSKTFGESQAVFELDASQLPQMKRGGSLKIKYQVEKDNWQQFEAKVLQRMVKILSPEVSQVALELSLGAGEKMEILFSVYKQGVDAATVRISYKEDGGQTFYYPKTYRGKNATKPQFAEELLSFNLFTAVTKDRSGRKVKNYEENLDPQDAVFRLDANIIKNLEKDDRFEIERVNYNQMEATKAVALNKIVKHKWPGLSEVRLVVALLPTFQQIEIQYFLLKGQAVDFRIVDAHAAGSDHYYPVPYEPLVRKKKSDNPTP